MKFWNWGPTTIAHYCMSVTFYFSKSLHPIAESTVVSCRVVLYSSCRVYSSILQSGSCRVYSSVQQSGSCRVYSSVLSYGVVWQQQSLQQCPVQWCRVGWSDFHFLRFSKMGTLLSIGYIFMSSIPKNRRNMLNTFLCYLGLFNAFYAFSETL